ncbi:MAG: hypothetical protein AMK69_20755 [Nitrospira bacterium SG8_3]|nr:MAG: hypothetical protein AMK69_20755 [Nitrospira bacterium SG8_3]
MDLIILLHVRIHPKFKQQKLIDINRGESLGREKGDSRNCLLFSDNFRLVGYLVQFLKNAARSNDLWRADFFNCLKGG